MELEALSKLFKIIGDPTRIRILWALDQCEMCVCDIANVLNMTKSSISHQLAILRSACIVKYRKQGKEVYYTLDDEHIKKLYEIGLIHIDHKVRSDKSE
jgi:ArsR family transcriptional regulator